MKNIKFYKYLLIKLRVFIAIKSLIISQKSVAKAKNNPVEIGKVNWSRDLDDAILKSQ